MPVRLGAREQERLVRRALDLVDAEAFEPSEARGRAPTYEPLGVPHRTSTQLTVVLLQQTHRGVPIRDAVRSARLGAPRDASRLTGSPSVVPHDLGITPTVGVVAASYVAARYLADSVLRGRELEVSTRRPRLVTQLSDPRRTSVLEKAPFAGPIVASLVVLPRGWVGMGEEPTEDVVKRAALAWEVRLELRHGGGVFTVYVEASGRRARSPGVLDWSKVTAHATSAQCSVCEWDPATALVPRAMPRAAVEYNQLGIAQLEAWVDTDSTAGINVRAVVAGQGPVKATRNAQGDLVFPSNALPTIHDAVVNAFYWCNVAHDFFHHVGFTEATRNFQLSNRTGLGSGGDAVLVTQFVGGVDGLGEFINRLDGRQPEMKLGVKDGRFAGLDVDVVLHEYAHGVVNRTVSNGSQENPFRQRQSLALSEGYCDYFALSLQNFLRPAGSPDWVMGGWIGGGPSGLRASPYRPGFTATYGSLKNPGFTAHHDAGQVWCAALLDIEEAAVAQLGNPAGHEFTWRLVFDSLTLLHTGQKGPTFVHAREAIMDELTRKLGGPPENFPVGQAVLQAFHARGLGPNATSSNAGFSGIVEDVT